MVTSRFWHYWTSANSMHLTGTQGYVRAYVGFIWISGRKILKRWVRVTHYMLTCMYSYRVRCWISWRYNNLSCSIEFDLKVWKVHSIFNAYVRLVKLGLVFNYLLSNLLFPDLDSFKPILVAFVIAQSDLGFHLYWDFSCMVSPLGALRTARMIEFPSIFRPPHAFFITILRDWRMTSKKHRCPELNEQIWLMKPWSCTSLSVSMNNLRIPLTLKMVLSIVKTVLTSFADSISSKSVMLLFLPMIATI